MTHDELLNALVPLIPEGDEEGDYTNDFRASLLRGLIDVKEKRTHTSEEVKKQLGIWRQTLKLNILRNLFFSLEA